MPWFLEVFLKQNSEAESWQSFLMYSSLEALIAVANNDIFIHWVAWMLWETAHSWWTWDYCHLYQAFKSSSIWRRFLPLSQLDNHKLQLLLKEQLLEWVSCSWVMVAFDICIIIIIIFVIVVDIYFCCRIYYYYFDSCSCDKDDDASWSMVVIINGVASWSGSSSWG